MILNELFPNQVEWLWNNFDIGLINSLINSSITLRAKQNNEELESDKIEEIKSKIEKDKQNVKDWIDKNKNIIVNGKTLEELANFKF